MKKFVVCIEIDNLAKDEAGNPCPAGAAMEIELDDSATIPEYSEIVENINVPRFLEFIHLDGITDESHVRFLTPEEYDSKYGFDSEDDDEDDLSD